MCSTQQPSNGEQRTDWRLVYLDIYFDSMKVDSCFKISFARIISRS